MKRNPYDGEWDAAKIRRAREYGWFRVHEADMIEAARKRRLALENDALDEKKRPTPAEAPRAKEKEQAAPAAASGKCPQCGRDLAAEELSGERVERCPGCRGVFLAPGALERILARHDAHRGGILQQLSHFRHHH